MPEHIEVVGVEGRKVVFGANQPEYRPFPGVIVDEQTGCVLTRWAFTDEERAQIAAGAQRALHEGIYRTPSHRAG